MRGAVVINCCTCSYSNHERSKKHRENVAILKEIMQEEEEAEVNVSSAPSHGVEAAGGSSPTPPPLSESVEEDDDSAVSGVAQLKVVDEREADLKATAASSSDGDDVTLSSLVRYVLFSTPPPPALSLSHSLALFLSTPHRNKQHTETLPHDPQPSSPTLVSMDTKADSNGEEVELTKRKGKNRTKKKSTKVSHFTDSN